MPFTNVTPGSVHVSAPLTNLAIQYKNLALVGERILPVVPVAKEADKYYVFRKEELVDEDARRTAGSEAREISWDVDTATYSAEEFALRHLVPDRVVANADVPIRPKMTSTQKLMKKILLGEERRIAQLVQNQANLGNSATPAPRWNGASPTIEKDVDTAKDWIRTNAGVEPTSIVLPYKVAQVVKRDSTIRDLIRYTVPGDVLLRNGDLPPVLWNLETIIAGAIRRSSNEGASETLVDVWTDNVLVFYKEASPSLENLSLGYIFRVGTALVVGYRVETRKGDMVEVSQIQDEKIVATACGYQISDVIAGD